MAANGTPQSALYARRPVNTTRDRSMEQNNTSSGNPYGYVPQGPQYNSFYGGQQPTLGRYAPPQGYGNYQPMNFQQGPYAYNSPNNYGVGTTPSGQQFTPQYQPPPGMNQNQQPGNFQQSAGGGMMVNPQQMQQYMQFMQQYQNQVGLNQAYGAALNNPQYNPQYAGPQANQAASSPAFAARGGYAPQPAPTPQQAPVPYDQASVDKGLGRGNFHPSFDWQKFASAPRVY